ncbi:hypothetical protein JL721_11199 [Aureococcus anophagefferens]|nr:hypothetical protein JL721_11199 [Aureococcus anophagefferens]
MLAYVLLAAVARAQQYGNGLGKHTYSVSQAHAASQFLMTMLPVQTDYPSKAESCGQLGRTRVAVAPVPNGTCHLHAQGAASPRRRATPSRTRSRSLDAVRATGAYDAFLDFTTGFWVASLDRLCDPTPPGNGMLKWQTYYSVIVRAASSSILIELMSETCATACDAALPHPHARYVFRDGATVASVFGALTDKDAAKPLLHAARVSWPTSNLTRDRAFFVDGGLARAGPDGRRVAVDTYDFAKLSENAIMQFQLVERPAANTTGPLTVAAWETVMLDTHAAALRDDVCGFDQWMDHHAGLAVRNSTHTLGSLAELAAPRPLSTVNKGHGRRLDEAGTRGDYVPSRPIGSGEVDLCNMGTCPNASFLAAL